MKRLCPVSWNSKATSLTARLARRDRRELRIAIRRVSLTIDTEGTAETIETIETTGTSIARSQERETSLYQTQKTTLKTHLPSHSARKARLRGLIPITKDIKMKIPNSSR
jgi:chromosomal replication initiation ATPase DnaA